MCSDVGVPLTKVSRHSHGPPTGMRTVPTDDPVVQEAAGHALSTLQHSSNSLAPYQLSEIVSAEAEVEPTSAFLFLELSSETPHLLEKNTQNDPPRLRPCSCVHILVE
jgi:hypothetical protein